MSATARHIAIAKIWQYSIFIPNHTVVCDWPTFEIAFIRVTFVQYMRIRIYDWVCLFDMRSGELTALQRSEQVARWVELTGGKLEVDDDKPAQHAQKLGRPEGGIRAATRELGIQRDDARRSIAVRICRGDLSRSRHAFSRY